MSRMNYGAIVLSDFDPELGKLLLWKPKKRTAKIFLFDKRATVRRDTACVLARLSGNVIGTFSRGYLLARVRQYSVEGEAPDNRKGFVVTVTWYRTYATGYQERHTGGEDGTELYAIVLDDKLVHRQAIAYPEISTLLPQTAGQIVGGLCSLKG